MKIGNKYVIVMSAERYGPCEFIGTLTEDKEDYYLFDIGGISFLLVKKDLLYWIEVPSVVDDFMPRSVQHKFEVTD